MSNLSNLRCRPKSAFSENMQFLQIYWISNTASWFVFIDLKYLRRQYNGHNSVPGNNEQLFEFTMFNSAQKAKFCNHFGNRQCHNGHNGDGLGDFGSITTKPLFIMATSWYNCAMWTKTVLAPDQIRQYRPDYAHFVVEGPQSSC